jgi:hypothetical protein
MQRCFTIILLLALAACAPARPSGSPVKQGGFILTGKIAHIGKDGFALDNGSKTTFVGLDPVNAPVLKKLKKGQSITLLGTKVEPPAGSGTSPAPFREVELDEIVLASGKHLPLQ